jgi:hypothetical protein
MSNCENRTRPCKCGGRIHLFRYPEGDVDTFCVKCQRDKIKAAGFELWEIAETCDCALCKEDSK